MVVLVLVLYAIDYSLRKMAAMTMQLRSGPIALLPEQLEAFKQGVQSVLRQWTGNRHTYNIHTWMDI